MSSENRIEVGDLVHITIPDGEHPQVMPNYQRVVGIRTFEGEICYECKPDFAPEGSRKWDYLFYASWVEKVDLNGN